MLLGPQTYILPSLPSFAAPASCHFLCQFCLSVLRPFWLCLCSAYLSQTAIQFSGRFSSTVWSASLSRPVSFNDLLCCPSLLLHFSHPPILLLHFSPPLILPPQISHCHLFPLLDRLFQALCPLPDRLLGRAARQAGGGGRAADLAGEGMLIKSSPSPPLGQVTGHSKLASPLCS